MSEWYRSPSPPCRASPAISPPPWTAPGASIVPKSRMPLLDASRVLLTTENSSHAIGIIHAGSIAIALSGVIGICAGLTVAEGPSRPFFRRHEAIQQPVVGFYCIKAARLGDRCVPHGFSQSGQSTSNLPCCLLMRQPASVALVDALRISIPTHAVALNMPFTAIGRITAKNRGPIFFDGAHYHACTSAASHASNVHDITDFSKPLGHVCGHRGRSPQRLMDADEIWVPFGKRGHVTGLLLLFGERLGACLANDRRGRSTPSRRGRGARHPK